MIAAIHAGVRAGHNDRRRRDEEQDDENLQLLPQVADFDAPEQATVSHAQLAGVDIFCAGVAQ